MNTNVQLVNKNTNSFRQQGIIMSKFKTTKNSPDRKNERNLSDEKGKVVIQNNAIMNDQNIITNYEKYHQNATTTLTNTSNISNHNSNFTSNNNINNQELYLLKKKLFKKNDKIKPLNFTKMSNVSSNKINETQVKNNNTAKGSQLFNQGDVQKSVDTKKEMNCTLEK